MTAPGSGVSGIVLAAGTSSRLGAETPKLLLELDGRPLLRWVVEAALGSRLVEVIVVLGHAASEVADALDGLAVTTLLNPDYRHGQSTSVRAGLMRASPEARAALFIPADQPLLSNRLIDRLIDAYGAAGDAGGPIVVPAHQGRRGAPVLFDRAYFAELAALTGDAGGRKLLPRHQTHIVEVAVDDPSQLADVDTLEDLRRLQQRSAGGWRRPSPGGREGGWERGRG